MNTKEKIIYESLNLFSIKGFDAISVRDIANKVGIKASSIYNHFKNKQDIFDTIIEKYSTYANQILKNINTRNNTNSFIINKFKDLSDDQFLKIHMKMFRFYLEDEYMVKFRKILTIEQFNNPEISKIYHEIFIDNILDAHTKILIALMDQKLLISRDAYTLSIQLCSPVFLLFYKYGNVTDKESQILKNHILEFRNTYTMKG